MSLLVSMEPTLLANGMAATRTASQKTTPAQLAIRPVTRKARRAIRPASTDAGSRCIGRALHGPRLCLASTVVVPAPGLVRKERGPRAGLAYSFCLSADLTLTLDVLVWLMTIVSDHVATALVLLEIGDPEAVNRTSADFGLRTARLASFDEMWAGAPLVRHPTARHLAEAYALLDDGSREKLFRQ